MISKKILFISLIFALLIASCNKKGCTDSLALNYNEKAKKDDGSCEFLNQNTKALFLQTHHFYDSLTFYLDSTYNDDFGTKIKFNRASFYLGKNGFYDDSNISIDDTRCCYKNKIFSWFILKKFIELVATPCNMMGIMQRAY